MDDIVTRDKKEAETALRNLKISIDAENMAVDAVKQLYKLHLLQDIEVTHIINQMRKRPSDTFGWDYSSYYQV